MYRNLPNSIGDGSDGSAPSEAWLFAQAILGNSIPRIVSPETKARAEREQLERLAQFSSRHAEELCRLQAAEAEARHDRELLEWAARISTRAEDELRALQRQEAEEREAWRRAELFVESLLESNLDSSQHPRAPRGQPDGGQWVGKGGGASSVGGGVAPSRPFRTADFHSGQTTAQIVAFAGAASSWPTSGPMPSWLPKVSLPPGVGAGAVSRTAFGVIAGALGNASMTSYWQRLSPREAMVYAWVYELEKRVRAGKLTREEAKEIFTTAVFGAHAQGFAPTGDRPYLVHKSAADFLAKAEAVYFARKKKQLGWAKLAGGYQQSGGRVFPTKHNSGLDGYALRQEQEKFFERGLAEGKDPGYLRGQAKEAGLERIGRPDQPDRLEDPDSEAALQRALQNVRNKRQDK